MHQSKELSWSCSFALEKSYSRKLVIFLAAEKDCLSVKNESRAPNIIQTGKNEPCRMFRCGEALGALKNVLRGLMPSLIDGSLLVAVDFKAAFGLGFLCLRNVPVKKCFNITEHGPRSSMHGSPSSSRISTDVGLSKGLRC